MPARPTFQPQVEPLESRDLLAGVTAYVQGANLFIQGTTGNDYLSVTQNAGRLSVYGTSISVGGARVGSVDAASVTRVFIDAYAGNDIIIANTLTRDVVVSGGAGNDAIYSGSGNDFLNAGAGDDLVYGGAGNDCINAGVNVNERDTVLGGAGFDWYYRPFKPGVPIVNGTSVADVRQGEAPLCQTAAALAEAANQGHNFASDLRNIGNNTYEVKLRGSATPQKVRFDGWINDQDMMPTASGEFWTVLFQRARLQSLGIDPLKEQRPADWDALNQKSGGRLYSINEALYQFTGSIATYRDISAATPVALQTALSRGDLFIAQSAYGWGVSGDGIVRNHAYAILGVFQEDGVWKVRLYNPWGMDRENGGTLDALAKTRAANDGIITLSWQQFTKGDNFKGYFQAVKK